MHNNKGPEAISTVLDITDFKMDDEGNMTKYFPNGTSMYITAGIIMTDQQMAEAVKVVDNSPQTNRGISYGSVEVDEQLDDGSVSLRANWTITIDYDDATSLQTGSTLKMIINPSGERLEVESSSF